MRQQTSPRYHYSSTAFPLLLAALALLALPGEARAQWTTDTNAHTITTTTDKVGVGTANPAAQVEVKRDQATGTEVRVSNADTTGGFAGFYLNGGFSQAAGGFMQWNNVAGNNNLFVATGGNYPLHFGTNNSIRMTVQPTSGNVGIGTTAPGAWRRLHVIGGNIESQFSATAGQGYGLFIARDNNHIAQNAYLDGSAWRAMQTGKAAIFQTNIGGGHAFFVQVDNTSRAADETRSFNPVFAIQLDGNVGIGTTTPTGRLHVTYGTNAWYFLSGASPTNKGLNAGASWSTTNGTQLTFNAYGGGTELITEFGPNYAVNGGTGIERYAINGGKKAPVIQMSADAGSISLFGESGTGAAWRTPTLNLGLHVSAGGNVGVGTTASTNYKLDVAGVVRSSSGGFSFPDGTVQTTAATGGGSQWAAASGGVTGIQYGGGSVGVGTPSPAGKFEVAGGSIFMGDMGQPGWGTVIVRGRVFSSSNNLHLSPPGGTTVYINSDYREAGGQTGPVNLDVSGSITGGSIQAKYQDVAEWVPSTQELSAGTVVVLDAGRTNHVLASSSAYDTKVAGVISEQPGVILGTGGEGKVKVATTGRVKVRVDAAGGAIRVGDLLVTSDVEGMAMKSVPVNLGGTQIHRPGTIIGKALEPLEKGVGEILVLLSLQ